MSIIKVENLTFSYPSSADNVFENASFVLDTDWKTGVVGRNGRGKTTLMSLLLGKYEYKGSITSSVVFDYFPYDVENECGYAYDVLNEVCPTGEPWRFERELNLLGAGDDVFQKRFCELSAGERTKVLLAALFLNEGRFLLIDEPTNHLDAHARAVVAAYLKRKRGFMLVSHDRSFLDGCVDHILSINRSGVEVVGGNFSSWYRDFTDRQTAEKAQDEKLKRDIKRLKQSAERVASWADRTEAEKHGKTSGGLKPDKGYVGHKAQKLMKRATVTRDRIERAAEQKAELLKNNETAPELKISPQEYFAETLVSLKNVSVRYGNYTACDNVSFDIRRGERVFISGKNGSGKSSILKLVTGQNTAAGGEVKIGSRLVVSYVPQDASRLTGTLKELAAASGIDESLYKAVLRKMDFSREQFENDMREFSAGQKKKALIAKSLCEKAHLYVWDEPLNYIDIYSRLQIENLIKEFEPTMLVVEHDAAFKAAIATKTVEL